MVKKSQLVIIIGVIIVVSLLLGTGLFILSILPKKTEWNRFTWDAIGMRIYVHGGNVTNSSYLIIPAPIQHNKTLEFTKNQSDEWKMKNYTFTCVDTEKGKGIKIQPIPDDIYFSFSCEPYEVYNPGSLPQTNQFIDDSYPGLSTWETNGNSSYYWFYCSSNITSLEFFYIYCPYYDLVDHGYIDHVETAGWLKISYYRRWTDESD
jgi:hypothetical protein